MYFQNISIAVIYIRMQRSSKPAEAHDWRHPKKGHMQVGQNPRSRPCLDKESCRSNNFCKFILWKDFSSFADRIFHHFHKTKVRRQLCVAARNPIQLCRDCCKYLRVYNIYIYIYWMEICGTSNSLCQIQDLKLCWPPAKIGTLSTSGASSTQTLPNRLKLDKPTSVNRISVVATPLNRMGQQHLGNCGFVASRMWINMMHSKILYNMWLYISLYIYSTYIHNISNIYIYTYIHYIYIYIFYIIYYIYLSLFYIVYIV